MSRIEKPFPGVEVRYAAGQDGGEELDEIVAQRAAIHLERMDDAQWWMSVTVDGHTLLVNVGAVNPRAKGYGSAWVDE